MAEKHIIDLNKELSEKDRLSLKEVAEFYDRLSQGGVWQRVANHPKPTPPRQRTEAQPKAEQKEFVTSLIQSERSYAALLYIISCSSEDNCSSKKLQILNENFESAPKGLQSETYQITFGKEDLKRALEEGAIYLFVPDEPENFEKVSFILGEHWEGTKIDCEGKPNEHNQGNVAKWLEGEHPVKVAKLRVRPDIAATLLRQTYSLGPESPFQKASPAEAHI